MTAAERVIYLDEIGDPDADRLLALIDRMEKPERRLDELEVSVHRLVRDARDAAGRDDRRRAVTRTRR